MNFSLAELSFILCSNVWCELVKALVAKFQGPITEMCSSYVGVLLQQYAAAPDKEWKLKDCAIFLVMALTVRGKVASRGATATNELVDIPDFYRSHILTELRTPTNSQPVLKADAEALPSRLALCRLTADTLKAGLGLLGIATLERM